MSKGDLILPINYVPSLGEFLDILQVKPASFAAQLFTRIYDQFFNRSRDLRAEYNRYYCVEYTTFEIYLELAHEIYLDSSQIEKSYILEIDSSGGVLEEAYDDNVRDVVIECVKNLEDRHED